jgi:GNAT superfamily N-acetyltransferase
MNLRRGGIHYGHLNEEGGGLQLCSLLREFDPAVDFQNNMWDGFVDKVMVFWLVVRAKIGGALPSVFANSTTTRILEERGKNIEKLMKEAHQNYGPKEKHIYAVIFATDPDYQGQGYGGQLMKQAGEIADASSQSCYLERSGEKNRTFYEKFGYKVAREELIKDEIDDTEILIFFIIRPPTF